MAHSLSLREAILGHRQIGLSMTEISATLRVSYSSVRALCKRYSECDQTAEGITAVLQPHYDSCGPQAKRLPPDIVEAAIRLKRLHPSWGVPRLMIDLGTEMGDTPLPSIRTLNRWFREAGLVKPPRQTGEPTIGRARAVHNIWEVDAKENIILQNGQEACYLTTVDEKSGAWLASPVFPL
jgi:hypothetical protein